ncbi:2-hydroxyacid dehydrogenase [Thermocatellispora tengchongensis]|uniref:2-hydroxyacid dehydrogenase n=1 Tax=Thermocatellispora tengchongensis TaxID=1073253 RepID=UPI003CD09C8C
MLKVLAAGDHFVRPGAVAEAIRAELGGRASVRELTGPWPIEPFGPVAEVHEASGDEDELIAALDGAEVAVTQMAPFTERVLAAAPALRLVVVTRGGPVNVNLAAAEARGVEVRSTPGRNAPAAAELAVALTLGALRRLAQVDATMRAGEWRSDLYAYDACGGELSGAEVGVVGFGAIGRRVAAVFEALGARVLVHDPFAAPPPSMEQVKLPDLLARSRVVSLHARLTPETRHMIGASELALMPRDAVLVNTARGALVDTEALTEALTSGRLAGAALDVYDPEPLPADHPLRALPNVLLTPHLAGATRQTADRAVAMAAREVAAYYAATRQGRDEGRDESRDQGRDREGRTA